MTKWNYLLKIVHRSSVFLLFFIPGLLILWRFIPLEFASDNIQDNCYIGLGIIFLAAILGTLAGTLKRTDNPALIVVKILLTLLAAFGALMLIAIFALMSMCSYSIGKILFINKNNSNITIVSREFGCGATDSGPPTIRTVKKRNITPFFIHITAIDTNTIDKEKWIRVETGD